jgi:hypothetical protein
VWCPLSSIKMQETCCPIGQICWVSSVWPDWAKFGHLATFYLNMATVRNIFFWFKQVLDRGPEQRESKLTVLCPLIIRILISYIIIYYIIFKLLIMENHPSQNWKRNFTWFVLNHLVVVGWRSFELSIFSYFGLRFGQIYKNWASFFSIFWANVIKLFSAVSYNFS